MSSEKLALEMYMYSVLCAIDVATLFALASFCKKKTNIPTHFKLFL